MEGSKEAARPPRNRLARRVAAATCADAFTVDEYCERHRICRSLLYSLWREGRGPKFMKMGGRRLISVEAATEYRKQLEAASSVPE